MDEDEDDEAEDIPSVDTPRSVDTPGEAAALKGRSLIGYTGFRRTKRFISSSSMVVEEKEEEREISKRKKEIC